MGATDGETEVLVLRGAHGFLAGPENEGTRGRRQEEA